MLSLDRADRRDEFAHLLVRCMAHVDAEDVGAGAKQPIDDGPLRGGRTQRCHDLGPAQTSHRLWLPGSPATGGPGAWRPPVGPGMKGVYGGSGRVGASLLSVS